MRTARVMCQCLLFAVLFILFSCGSNRVDSVSNAHISGVLHNSYGYPASGVTITLESNGTTYATDITDTDGNYRLEVPLGKYELKITGNGYLSSPRTIDVTGDIVMSTQFVDVNSATHGIVIGQITLDGQTVVANAIVSDGAKTTLTSSTGLYAMTLEYGTADLSFSKTGHVEILKRQTLNTENPYAEIDIILPRDAENYGMVYGNIFMELDGIQNATVPYAEVSLYHFGEITSTTYADKDGYFNIIVPYGEYRLAGKSDTHIETYSDEFMLSSSNQTAKQDCTLQLDTLNHGSIYGVVTDSFGVALGEVSIAFDKNGDPSDEVITDSKGNFHTILTHGTYQVIFRKYGFEQYSQSISLTKENPFYRINGQAALKEKASYSLYGKVTDSQNNPIASAKVEAYVEETLIRTDTTDNSGNYSLQLYSGSYTLRGSADYYMSFKDDNFGIISANVELDIVLMNTPANHDKISSSNNDVLYLDSHGALWAWGHNTHGNVGDGSTSSVYTPKNISELYPTLDEFVMVAAGKTQSYSLNSKGELYGWGLNDSGQLGDGSTMQRLSPTLLDLRHLPEGEKIVQVANSAHTALAVTDQGSVLAWGNNFAGQLGFPGNDPVLVPKVIPIILDAVAVEASTLSTTILTGDGKVYAWGDNTFGQLGVGDHVNITHHPQLVEGFDGKVVKISSKGLHVLALTEYGTLYGWGSNSAGQLDEMYRNQMLPIKLADNAKTMYAGDGSTYIVLSNNTVLMKGDMDQQYNLAPLENEDIMVIIEGKAITDSEQVYSWGREFITGTGENSIVPLNITNGLK